MSQRPYLELLIESEKMRAILLSIKTLSTQSDGVIINGELVLWSKALPLLSAFPDVQATYQQKEEWMTNAVSSWESEYYNRIKNVVARSISEKSTLENDNLYLWSLLNPTSRVLGRIIEYSASSTTNKNVMDAEPSTLNAAKDLLAALKAVVSGSLSTARIRNELFLSGIDNVLMEFQMLYTNAKNSGHNERSDMYIEAMAIIRELRDQTEKMLR